MLEKQTTCNGVSGKKKITIVTFILLYKLCYLHLIFIEHKIIFKALWTAKVLIIKLSLGNVEKTVNAKSMETAKSSP